MTFTANDVVPFTVARAKLSKLAEQAKAGTEKIITRNGESHVALIDAGRLDYDHLLERERIHLLLIEDASRPSLSARVARSVDARDPSSAALSVIRP